MIWLPLMVGVRCFLAWVAGMSVLEQESVG